MAKAGILWNCPPRTRVKLEILRHYLGAWFGILAQGRFPHVYYVDGFCGPGEYSGGEEGSPVIAARFASRTAKKYPGFRATLIFIDKNHQYLNHLATLDALTNQHPNIEIDIREGEFTKETGAIVEMLRDNPNSPTFSFIDPFGFGHSPLDKIKLLMHNQSSEVFINFWCGFMNRFKEHDDQEITSKIRNMAGVRDLSFIINSPDRIDAFCQVFADNLREIGPYTLRFMMRDEKNSRHNAFFFCGRNSMGFKKIKEAMWKADPVHGNSFSAHEDIKNRGEAHLFEESPQTRALAVMILKQFGGQKRVQVKDVFKWVIENTDTFLETHARIELENLHERGQITSVIDPLGSSRKRGKRQWPDRLLLDFGNDKSNPRLDETTKS